MSNSRYSNQIKLKEIGSVGQLKLKNTKVTVIGCGGLGHSLTTYLGASGVGHIVLIDGDQIELANLNRQFCFTENDLGKNKAEILKLFLKKQNPKIKIESINNFLTVDNISSNLMDCDYIVDCTDNINIKFLIHDHCYQNKLNLVQGAVFKYDGKIINFPFQKDDSFCWRCLWSEIPKVKNCNDTGSLGPVLGIFGSMLALEVIKNILSISPANLGTEIHVDLLDYSILKNKWKKNDECSLCVKQNLSFTYGIDELINFEVDSIDNFKEIYTIDREVNILNKNIKYIELHDIKSLFNTNNNQEDKNKILLICKSGNLSFDLVQNLRKQGHNNFYSLKNGIKNL